MPVQHCHISYTEDKPSLLWLNMEYDNFRVKNFELSEFELNIFELKDYLCIRTSRKLKGPTAQGLICKQSALRTEHDSIAKN